MQFTGRSYVEVPHHKDFADLSDRVMQCGFWAQATADDWQGGQYERICDPWQSVSRDVNSLGQIYVSELALEANLQLLEMGLATASSQ